MHLDPHSWEEMKRRTPAKGPGSMAATSLGATLLALWFRAADLGSPTLAQVSAVLRTINVRDSNASRGLQRADWLQMRPGGRIVLNPAQVSKAIGFAKAFCAKQWGASEPK